MVAVKELALKVAEAIQDDVNKGIVRVDSSMMQEIDVRPGDIVEIAGERKTVAIVDRAYPSDLGLNLIRMDGIIRRNAKTGIGEVVKVKKAEVKEAKKVTIAPARRGIHIKAPANLFKQGLLGRAMVKGDIVSLGGTRRRRTTMTESPFFEDVFSMLDESLMGFGFGDIKFLVVDAQPKQAVIITDTTEVEFNPEAVEVKEEAVLDISYEDIGGLEEEIKKVREMVELPLKHPEIFERLGIEPPKGVLLHGPPGTGKTLLAKAVANETNANFILINGPEIMCVSGDTKIFTNPNGMIEAQELFNIAQGETVREGAIKAIKLDVPVTTYAFSNGNIEKAHITHVAKLRAPAFRVALSDGNTLTCSQNQPFLVFANGQHTWKRLGELRQGMFVARVNQLPLPAQSQSLAVPAIETHGGKFAPRSRNLSRSNWVRLPATSSVPLWECIGLLVAEGYTADDGVTFCNTNPQLRQRYQQLLRKLFGITKTKTYADGRVVVYSKALVAYLEQFGLLPGKKKPTAPALLHRVPIAEAAAFVRGYFEGDGTVSLNGKYPTPKLYSATRSFLHELQGILQLKLGISSSVRKHPTPKGMMHALVVRGSRGRMLFATRVGTITTKNKSRLRHLASTVREHAHIPTPALLLQTLRSRVPYSAYRNNDWYVYEKGNFTKHAMRKLYRILDRRGLMTPAVRAECGALLREDLAWEQIVDITPLGMQELYDFTVDKDSFMASPYLLLHNSKYYGQSEENLRKKFEDAEKNAPSIIFIDEIDAIASKREEAHGEVERRVVAQLLALMDGLKSRGKVVVIAASNLPNQLDIALRRPGRFDREIEIAAPNKEGRLNILKIHTRNMPLAKTVNLKEIAAITHGFVGADLSALAKEAAIILLRRVFPDLRLNQEEAIPKEILEKLYITQKDFREALKVVRPSAMREVLVEVPTVKWDEIGGLADAKQELQEAVEWPLKYPEAFRRLGVEPPKGVLLYGAPGTGKTMLAKAVATESEANFILVKGPELFSKWVGESLPYDEELIVKKNGLVTRMKIGDIVENKEDIEVLSFDKDKRVAFSQVDGHIKHKLTTNLLQVTTRTGRTIRVTQDHSLFSFMNGKLESVPTSSLIPGESYVAVPKRLNLPRERMRDLNLYDYFKKDHSIFVGNIRDYLLRAKKILGSKAAASTLGISIKYLDDVISKNLPVLISSFDDLTTRAKLAIDLREIQIKLKGSVHRYPAFFPVDKDFWRLVGLWVAEGDFNGYTVRVHNRNEEIREDAENICKKYGFSTSKSKVCFSINSLFLQKLFRNVLGLPAGAQNKRIPEIVYILDKEGKANFLKGYFSGDGSIYPRERGKYSIEAGTVSEKLANDLLYLLLDFGIVATLYKKLERTGSITFRISILGVKNFENFKDIGFVDSVRNSYINTYIQSRKWTRSEVIPLSGPLYELAARNVTVGNSIGKERLKQVLVYVDKDKAQYKEYWDLVEGDVFFDLVKDVKLIKNEEYVYDVSVPEGQNFVAGFGGIFAHNSEKAVREIFRKARQTAPTIIFFDEMDALAPRRGMSESHASERVVNQLLTEIDGLEDLHDVVVIGSTNRPDIIDASLLRPGRFDRIVLVKTPDVKSRMEIFTVHTKDMPLAKDVNLQELAERTEGYTGADIEGVCKEAAIFALREDIKAKEVQFKHFSTALEKVRPSITPEVEKVYEELLQQFRAAKAKEIMQKPSYFG